MIVTRTPLRISFAGGGSDFPNFYRRHGGTVLASAIDKYIHVILQDRYDDKIRVGYSTTELADSLENVQHELVRESMRRVGIDRGIELSTMADVPSTGTGLGSSSSVTVGLLEAMYAHVGDPQTRKTLARDAATIEIDVLGKPIGIQDQYIASFGGFRRLRFRTDDTVDVETVALAPDVRHRLDERLMLFYTGIGRDASSVLEEQRSRVEENESALGQLIEMADEMHEYLLSGSLDEFGLALDHCWSIKKGLASNVSNEHVDALYSAAKTAGALGGKITGAGGGGFLLLYCESSKQRAVRKALTGLRELFFHLEPDGAKVLFRT